MARDLARLVLQILAEPPPVAIRFVGLGGSSVSHDGQGLLRELQSLAVAYSAHAAETRDSSAGAVAMALHTLALHAAGAGANVQIQVNTQGGA